MLFYCKNSSFFYKPFRRRRSKDARLGDAHSLSRLHSGTSTLKAFYANGYWLLKRMIHFYAQPQFFCYTYCHVKRLQNMLHQRSNIGSSDVENVHVGSKYFDQLFELHKLYCTPIALFKIKLFIDQHCLCNRLICTMCTRLRWNNLVDSRHYSRQVQLLKITTWITIFTQRS